ncbi:MAG TPA: hypothetical protein VFD22_02380 [Gemmatimonadaceae bacterium]|nr:hypothetical protein [Gemmatimonadaceae bacterium]
MKLLVVIGVLISTVSVNAQESHADPAAADHAAPLLGTIDFPVTASAASQQKFIRGVLFMHNFHYPEAAAEFAAAEMLDPSNVMAYWGEAMTYTHPVWNQQDTTAARAALAKLGPSRDARLAKAHTERERLWLEAAEALYADGGTKAQRDTAYSLAMSRVFQHDTTDIEARAFYALSLLGLNQGDRDPGTYRRAYELLSPAFKAHPRHPGLAHYLIHSVDDPDHAGLGLAAANAYGEIAPAAAHALHMTSHIYLALGQWDDVLKANFRAHATLPNGQLSGHGSHWINYSLIQLGRYREADHWLDSMVRQAKTTTSPDRKQDSWNAAGIMAAASVVDSHRYNTRAAFVRVDTTYFNAASYTEAMVDLSGAEFGYGMAALKRGDRGAVDSVITYLEKLRSDAASDATKATSRGFVEVMAMSLRGYKEWDNSKLEDALKTFREAAALEASLPMPFGPPVVIKPPRESAGELLLLMKQPAAAKAEFTRALARTPKRVAVLLGLARSEKALGNREVSRKLYREVLAIWHNADAKLPELVEVRNGSR